MITSNESRLSTPTPQTGRNSLQPLDGDISSQDDRLIGKDGLSNQVDRLHRLSSDIHEGHKMDSKTGIQECAGCCKPISERYMLKALDLYWHEDCLKCGCCDCRLGEVGSTLYTKANLILCRRDYLRLFGSTGYCSACSKVIPAFEMVMRARTNVYHLECFACQQCNHRFCVGDRFYLCDNKILCEYDYEERLVFANMAYNPNQLAQLKRQANGQIPSPSLPAPVRSIGSGDLNNNMSQQQSALKAPSS